MTRKGNVVCVLVPFGKVHLIVGGGKLVKAQSRTISSPTDPLTTEGELNVSTRAESFATTAKVNKHKINTASMYLIMFVHVLLTKPQLGCVRLPFN